MDNNDDKDDDDEEDDDSEEDNGDDTKVGWLHRGRLAMYTQLLAYSEAGGRLRRKEKVKMTSIGSLSRVQEKVWPCSGTLVSLKHV